MPHSMAVTVANRPSAPAMAFRTISGFVLIKNSFKPDDLIGSVIRVGQENSFERLFSFSIFLWAVRPTT